ncbi:interferon-inducible double-stranded RNA-dependent protein kinase activator A homolog isoform X2 [Harmonia axyridis]|uniref:interferon-inducible double-stranded RNA-dependent protein kinase activator A homolog isoform X2 n=1 Tax=Harmonia axyridis TaxID=115357 RepID=UPI001E2795FB|nr:interferon-inducible double-stranded RNA-dependent protein kinase activator A homolog isoform X2 [Harmonia axyridis]
MSKNTKTPAMLLQEYTVKKKISAPEYNLILSRCGTHENEFHYKVYVAGISALGVGRSKQVAKHSAASSALQILDRMGIYDIHDEPPNFQPNLHRNEPENPNEGCVNSIGCLQEICVDNKIPLPIFHEISDVGPPHCRQFTYECEIDSIKTQAIAKTKKQAKQLAAKLMLEKIKQIIPNYVVSNNVFDNSLPDQEAIHEYLRRQPFKVVSNKSTKIIDFPNCFKLIMKKLNLSISDIHRFLKDENEEGLKKLLEKFELAYDFTELQREPPNVVVALDIELETPFTILGTGSIMEEAKNNAVKKTFSTIKSYLKVVNLNY